jgi:hypothetical protein
MAKNNIIRSLLNKARKVMEKKNATPIIVVGVREAPEASKNGVPRYAMEIFENPQFPRALMAEYLTQIAESIYQDIETEGK